MDESSVFGTILRVLFEVLFQGLGRWLMDFIWARSRKVDEDALALVKKLKTTILSVEGMLNGAIQKHIANAAVLEWLNELEDAVYDAHILLNEVCAESSDGKLGSEATIKEIKRILNKLEYMAGQKDVLGLGELKISPLCKSPTTSFLQESHVYGRSDDMEAITRLLLLYDESSDVTSVITIVGDAGIGKTTLVQLVIDNDRIREHFDLMVWICVSNGFDAYSVTKAILEAATMSTCDIRELSVLQIRLVEVVSRRRLLLVLDDVSDSNCTGWEILKGPLRVCAKESKIVVTTCDENIAAMMRTLPAYHLNKLSFKDCWSIFARHAFHGGRFVADLELKVVGRGIVKKCKGLPLAAKTLGNLLRYQPNREEWDRILMDEIWDSSHDIISIIQNLSLKSRRSRWKESYASMKLSMRRHHSVATIHDKLIPVPSMYKTIRSKKGWLPKLLILWIIVWSILSLAVFNVTNNYLKVEREELYKEMCRQGMTQLKNHLKAHLDREYRFAIPLLQLDSYQNASSEEAMNKSYIDSLLDGYAEGEKRLLYPTIDHQDFCKRSVCGPHTLHPSTSDEKVKASFLKATALGKAELLSTITSDSNSILPVIVYPMHMSALSTSCSSSLQESMRSIVGYYGVAIPLNQLVENTSAITLKSQPVWLDVLLMVDRSNISLMKKYYERPHHTSDRVFLHWTPLEDKTQGWRIEIGCGHYEKLPLARTTIAITLLFFSFGILLGYTIHRLTKSILAIGEASFIIQELHDHTEATDAATSHQFAIASREITTPAQSILETLALLLNTELSPSQKGYAKLAHTCARNLLTTTKEVFKKKR